VTTGIWVVIASLTPIIFSRYGVADHELWLVSSLLALAIFAVAFAANARARENLTDLAATRATTRRAKIVLVYGSTIWLPTAILVLALGLVALGPFADQEQALYLTAVGLGLFMAATGLFVMVFWQRAPAAS
jgi:hypothetical protein